MRASEFLREETYMPSYDTFVNMPDVDSLFKTARGSAYAFFNNGSTIRDRSGENHADTTTGVQKPSTRTIFMTRDAFARLGVQGSTPPLEIVPDTPGKVKAISTEVYGPKPIGTQFTPSQSYSLRPEVGLMPVELRGNKLMHLGNEITEVIPRAQYKSSVVGPAHIPDHQPETTLPYGMNTKPVVRQIVPPMLKEKVS
jgi:hypothetical protein